MEFMGEIIPFLYPAFPAPKFLDYLLELVLEIAFGSKHLLKDTYILVFLNTDLW